MIPSLKQVLKHILETKYVSHAYSSAFIQLNLDQFNAIKKLSRHPPNINLIKTCNSPQALPVFIQASPPLFMPSLRHNFRKNSRTFYVFKISVKTALIQNCLSVSSPLQYGSLLIRPRFKSWPSLARFCACFVLRFHAC